MTFKVKLCNKPEYVTIFDAIIFLYTAKNSICLRHSRRTGTTGTFSTYFEQAAIKETFIYI